jgi:hypothetical protein
MKGGREEKREGGREELLTSVASSKVLRSL